MPRQTMLDVPGTLHHVIIRGIEKRRVIDNQEDGEDFVSRMGQIALDTGTGIKWNGSSINHLNHHFQVGQPEEDLITRLRNPCLHFLA